MLRHHGVEKALDVFSTPDAGHFPGSVNLLLLALTDGRQQEAMRFWKELVAADAVRAFLMFVPISPGLQAEAEREWQKWLERTPDASPWRKALCRLYLGKCSDEEFLELNRKDRNSLCSAYYFIAMRAMSVGDREKAMDYCQKSIDVGFYKNPEYTWSHGFLEQMKRDSGWPAVAISRE